MGSIKSFEDFCLGSNPGPEGYHGELAERLKAVRLRRIEGLRPLRGFDSLTLRFTVLPKGPETPSSNWYR